MKLKKPVKEHARKFSRAFREMLASRGIGVQNVDHPAPSGTEAEGQKLARHRDRRTRLGRG
jgi:hypothetical protein